MPRSIHKLSGVIHPLLSKSAGESNRCRLVLARQLSMRTTHGRLRDPEIRKCSSPAQTETAITKSFSPKLKHRDSLNGTEVPARGQAAVMTIRSRKLFFVGRSNNPVLTVAGCCHPHRRLAAMTRDTQQVCAYLFTY
jgi:hypothetical protein